MRRLFEIRKTLEPVKCGDIDEGFCKKHNKWCYMYEHCEVKVGSGFVILPTPIKEKHENNKAPYTQNELKKVESIVKETPFPDVATVMKLSKKFGRSANGIKHLIKTTRKRLKDGGVIC